MASSSSSAAIRMRNEELERQIAEMESKKSRGVSSSSVAMRLRNEQLERQLAQMESKKSGGLSSASAAIELRNGELERKLAAMGRSGGMSSASAVIHLRNVELERQLAEQESKKTMSLAIKLKNVQLERRLAEKEKAHPHGTRLENLDERHPFGLRSDPMRVPTLALSQSRQRQVNAREIKMTQLITEAQEVDLAFLVDATSSMKRYITEVKKKVQDIATSVKKSWPDLELRVAFAPYRDYGQFDRDEQETCDFTSDFSGSQSVFVSALSRIHAGGDGDIAEDVFSGLERVARLGWKSRTRVLVHIGDAPCHGSEFHSMQSYDYDKYLAGDKKRRNIGTLLKALRDDCRILCYLFVHIDSSTEKMLTVFKQHAGSGNWIHEEKLGNIQNLLNVVVTVSTNSIAQSVRLGDSGPTQVSKFFDLPLQTGVPNWNKIPFEEAWPIKYRFPHSLEDLFHILATCGKLDMVKMLNTTVQIARYPFSGDGSIRWPYHALVHQPPDAPKPMVVKRFKTPFGQDVSKVHASEAYLEQMEVQTVAAYMAEKFNSELARRSDTGDYKTVEFTLVTAVAVRSGTGRVLYNMERYLQGDWIRYTNNLNYVNTKEYAATLHAFSHWTYDRSNGLLMVTDLQGVKDNEKFWLCDPAVHCKDALRYERTRTNFGEPGMKRFLLSHQCNNICHSLGLAPTTNVPIASGTGTQLT